MTAGPSTLLAVTHPDGGDLGAWHAVVRELGIETRFVCPGAGDRLPSLDEVRAVVVLGGAENVPETARRPYLGDEVEFLAEVLREDVPVLGICLGAQLLCAATGGEVVRAAAPEIGWFGLDWLAAHGADPLFGGLPEPNRTYQWHSYECRPPRGATVLARTKVCDQVIRFGDSAWGVQFHPEVNEALLRAWWADPGSDEDARSTGLDPESAMRDAQPHLRAWQEWGRRLLVSFLKKSA